MPRRRPLAESLSAAVKDPAALKPSTKDSLTSRDCPCLFLATSWQTFYCVRLQLYEQLRGDLYASDEGDGNAIEHRGCIDSV